MIKYTRKQSPMYLIVYDISDNKERLRVDKLLSGYGFRVQKSVFECRVNKGQKQHLIQQLKQLKLSTGHVRFYAVHAQSRKHIGKPTKDFDSEHIYFIDNND